MRGNNGKDSCHMWAVILRCLWCCQVLEEQAAEAAAARAAAEADLARVKGKGSDIQRKARPSFLRPKISFYLFCV